MIGKTTRLLMIGAVCGVLALATTAQGKSIVDAMEEGFNTLDEKQSPSTVWPLVFEDNDRSRIVDLATGVPLGDPTQHPNYVQGQDWVVGISGKIDLVDERIQGVIKIQTLFTGDDEDSLDVLDESNGTQAITQFIEIEPGLSNANQMTAVFDLKATGVTQAYTKNWVTFKEGDLNQLLLAETQTDWGLNAKTAIAIFEDNPSTPTSPSLEAWTTDVGPASDGTLWAEAGFTPGDSTTDFYYVRQDEQWFLMSLDFLSGPPATSHPGPIANELGTTLVGSGNLWDHTEGGYVKGSDGDFKVLYAPVPPAVFGGLGLFGLGLLIGRRFF